MPTTTLERPTTYDETIEDEMEMLKISQTLKSRLADMDNPDMWGTLKEHLMEVEEIIATHNRGEKWNGL
jgi:hypothetical protein